MVPYTPGSHTRAWIIYPEVPSVAAFYSSAPSSRRPTGSSLPALSWVSQLTYPPTLSPQQPDVASQQSSQLALISWGGRHWCDTLSHSLHFSPLPLDYLALQSVGSPLALDTPSTHPSLELLEFCSGYFPFSRPIVLATRV